MYTASLPLHQFKWRTAALFGLTLTILLIIIAPTGLQAQTAVPIRGMVRALHQSAIATDLPVRVKRLYVREAESFKKGNILVEFDCERLEAELAAAKATMQEMQLALDSNLYLDQKGAIGRLDVEISRARADKARAEASSLQARIQHCKLIAPYDGRVVDLIDQ